MKFALTTICLLAALDAAASVTKDIAGSETLSEALPMVDGQAVYCDSYSNGNTAGYSIYRAGDGQDLGNAVWTGDSSECVHAASYANYLQNGLVCSRYYNNSNSTTAYSIYRIYDNKDLGKATIGDIDSCERATASLRNGIFCSTYILNGQTMWSMYDVYSGNDLGTQAYATLDLCEQNY